MAATFQFNPDRVAYLEKAGWEAYYDRKWLRVLTLMVQLNHEEFHMPWQVALQAAFDTMRAAKIFAPVENDIPKATAYLAQFFAKARRYAGIKADAQALAALEMDYWVVHRRLAIQRQQNQAHENIEEMVQSLTHLHAALFDLPETHARPSAELRARAAVAVDRITGKYSTDIAGDWREVEHYLQQAYQSVLRDS